MTVGLESTARLALPKLAELQVDEQTETTIKTLIQYVTILESNQQELLKMINTILQDLPEKLKQKVDKYMMQFQQNVIDKQLGELDETITQLTEVAKQQNKENGVDIVQLSEKINELEKLYNYDQMNQLFEDVAQIKQMLGQLTNKL